MLLFSIKRTVLTIGIGLLFAHQLAGFTLRQRMTTREVPDSICTLPSAASIFPTSSNRLNVWFLADTVASTDEFSMEWIQPSGAVHSRYTWSRGSGERCYWAWLLPQTEDLQPGTWAVRIAANGSPLFSLSFRLLPTSEACPTQSISHTSSTTSALAESDCRVGDFRRNDDMRYAKRYRFSLASSGVFRSDLSSSAFDAYLFLLDSNGNIIDEDDDDGVGRDAKIVRNLDPGSYTILVTSFRKETGAFRITTSWQDPLSCGVTDINPTGGTIDTLRSTDCPLSAFLPDQSPNRYARLYRLTVRQSGDLTVDLTSSAFDAFLFLLDSRYGTLQSNDDAAWGTDSRITRRMQPGVYYIVATTYQSGSVGRFDLVTDFSAGAETITLFLHGLNSDSDTWDQLNKDAYSGQCQKIWAGAIVEDYVPQAPCYLYTFSGRRDESGDFWPNGDGATFEDLGKEVGVVVDWIRSRHNLKVLILAGHSRGGLAARAYLQSSELMQRLLFRVGLVTIGTPHLGSPFGRVRSWLSAFGKKLSDEHCGWMPESKLRFAFAPSTGYLATAHNAFKLPSLDAPVSKAIRDLNARAAVLSNRVDLFGEIRSNLTKFGENLGDFPGDNREAVLDASTLIGCIAKDDAEKQTILDYIQLNIPETWLNEGDGIVPFESQQILKVTGVRGTVWYIDLKTKTSHVDETSRTASIKSVIDKVSSELNAMPPLAAPSLLPPVSTLAAPSPMPAPEAVEGRRLEEFAARLSPRWNTTISEALSSLRRDDRDHLYVLGRQALESFSSDDSEASQLGLQLLWLAGTEKAVAAAFESLTAKRGWTSDSAQSIAADFALLPFEKTSEVLINTLFVSPSESPSASAAATALAKSGEPSAVRALLQWARTLDEPGAAERTARYFRQIASPKAIVEFRKSILAEPFRDEIVSRTLKLVLAEMDIEPKLEEVQQ